MDRSIRQKLEEIVTEYGAEETLKQARMLFNSKYLQPRIYQAYEPVIAPDVVDDTLDGIAIALDAVESAVQSKEITFKDKAQLLYEKAKLDTTITVTEADAIMQIEGTGKDQYVMIGEKKVPLTNDTARDAYRHYASKDARTRLSEVNGRLAKIDAELQRHSDDMYAAKDMLEAAKTKANLQAAVLTFLATR